MSVDDVRERLGGDGGREGEAVKGGGVKMNPTNIKHNSECCTVQDDDFPHPGDYRN